MLVPLSTFGERSDTPTSKSVLVTLQARDGGVSTRRPTRRSFVAALDRVAAAHPGLDPLEAGLLAALDLGLPGDSRAFARTFGLEHALVLRALAGLEEAGHIAVTARDPRTQRTRYATPASGDGPRSSNSVVIAGGVTPRATGAARIGVARRRSDGSRAVRRQPVDQNPFALIASAQVTARRFTPRCCRS